ncbi:MAG: hypothetical protein GTO16_08810 [Candidatus Aminicenantes bacterium]|nr:hypothetical protein [Candidatus Aminicenantes bacterium]
MKKGKKFIALFLVFSLMMLSVNLSAKERRGAKLIITKKEGYQIEGELITVKPNSLLLLSITGKDVSVDIADIEVIRIVKVSEVWKEDKLSARHKIKSFSPTIVIAIYIDEEDSVSKN